MPVYLECRSREEESASEGATEVLGWLKRQWFNDPELQIEGKYATV